MKTPLKDKWKQRISELDKSKKYTDLKLLSIGDYASIPQNPRSSGITGFIKSIGSKNVVFESPYGGYTDNDYISIQEIKMPKEDIAGFYKPMEDAFTNYNPKTKIYTKIHYNEDAMKDHRQRVENRKPKNLTVRKLYDESMGKHYYELTYKF